MSLPRADCTRQAVRDRGDHLSSQGKIGTQYQGSGRLNARETFSDCVEFMVSGGKPGIKERVVCYMKGEVYCVLRDPVARGLRSLGRLIVGNTLQMRRGGSQERLIDDSHTQFRNHRGEVLISC